MRHTVFEDPIDRVLQEVLMARGHLEFAKGVTGEAREEALEAAERHLNDAIGQATMEWTVEELPEPALKAKTAGKGGGK